MIEKLNISKAIVDYMMPYSKHVILERAIIDVRDGLKPSQRLGLWSMFEAGVTDKKKRLKSVGVSGIMLKYHPHSDASAYETMSRLGQPDSLLHPLIDPKGNMGMRTSKNIPASSSRYTEMRLSSFAMELFKDINKNSVEMVDNFDNSLKQPEVLPSPFPSALVFGSSGIAVGFSSNVPSFNLKEVCDYTIDVLKGKEPQLLVPDFATGGEIVYDEKELKLMNDKGEGKVDLQSTWEVEDNLIIIDSIPFTTNIESIVDRVVALAKEGKLKEVTDIRNSTDTKGMRIEIDVKRGTKINQLMPKLLHLTPLKSSFSANMNVIQNNKPVKLGTLEIVKSWIDFRISSISRSLFYEKEDKLAKAHILEGMKKVLLDIDETVSIIKESKNDDTINSDLMKKFGLDEKQASTVSNLKLRNLNKKHIESKIKDLDSLYKDIQELEESISSEDKLKDIIVSQLTEIKKKYGVDRKTKIVHPKDVLESPSVVQQVEDYNTRLFITQEGYLKKVALTSLRGNPVQKLKDGDKIISTIDSTNVSDILVFTSLGNLHKIKQFEIEDCKLSNLGEYLPSLLSLDNGEDVLYVTETKDYSGYFLIGFENGKMAKIDMKSYVGNRKILKNSLNLTSKSIYFRTINEDIELLFVSDKDKIAILNTSIILPKSSRSTQGVQMQKQKDDSKTTLITSVENTNFKDLDYYRLANAGVGKYRKKEDIITNE